MVQNQNQNQQRPQILPTAELLTFLGFNVEANRNAIIQDIMPNGPVDLVNRDVKQLTETCGKYATRDTNPFTVTDHQLSLLISLVHWATRQFHVNLPLRFAGAATQTSIIATIREATRWRDGHKARVDRGNHYLTNKFSVKLNTQMQWKTWTSDLDQALRMIIGERGISVDYVIRRDANPKRTGMGETFTERAYHAALIDNSDAYKADAQTVHNVILENVDTTGAAYGYIVQLRGKLDGRKDIQALRKRFEAEGVTNSLVQDAENLLSTLQYKSERAMTFEQFRGKLERCYEILEENGCTRTDNEKIKSLWLKIQAPYLEGPRQHLLTQHTVKNMSFETILDSFAVLIPQLNQGMPGLTARVSQVGAVVHEGSAPASGAHLPDGSLFTGKYTLDQWNSESVKQHHNAIKAARAAHRIANGGGERKRGNKNRGNNYGKRGKREVKKLKATVASLESKISSLEKNSENPSPSEGKEEQSSLLNNNAGNAFGGREAKAKGKKQ